MNAAIAARNLWNKYQHSVKDGGLSAGRAALAGGAAILWTGKDEYTNRKAHYCCAAARCNAGR